MLIPVLVALYFIAGVVMLGLHIECIVEDMPGGNLRNGLNRRTALLTCAMVAYVLLWPLELPGLLLTVFGLRRKPKTPSEANGNAR